MTILRILALGLISTVLLTSTGCGRRGGGGGGGGGRDSGVMRLDGSTGTPGGSGLDRGRRITSLTPAEQRELCEWGVDLLGDGRMVMCGDGITLTTPTSSECLESAMIPPACPLTVADIEDCAMVLVDDLCLALSSPPECMNPPECATAEVATE